MRKVSIKQIALNKELSNNKLQLSEHCEICGRHATDLAHLFPRSIAPEYYAEIWNNRSLCRECHNKFDNDVWFRRKQKRLYNIALEHDSKATKRRFCMEEKDILDCIENEVDIMYKSLDHLEVFKDSLPGGYNKTLITLSGCLEFIGEMIEDKREEVMNKMTHKNK